MWIIRRERLVGRKIIRERMATGWKLYFMGVRLETYNHLFVMLCPFTWSLWSQCKQDLCINWWSSLIFPCQELWWAFRIPMELHLFSSLPSIWQCRWRDNIFRGNKSEVEGVISNTDLFLRIWISNPGRSSPSKMVIIRCHSSSENVSLLDFSVLVVVLISFGQ